jgi:hypothetical protein
MPRPDPRPFLALALSLLGVAGFIFLFVRDFSIYWLILSPVIFVVYQFPAVVVFWLYKKKWGKREGSNEITETELSDQDERREAGGTSNEM